MLCARIAFSVLVGLLAAGCPGRSTSDAGPADADGIDVTGTQIDEYLLNDGGLLSRAVDLSGADISASSFLEDGGFALFRGGGTVDGTFIVPGVSRGRYFLRIDSTFIDMDQSTHRPGDSPARATQPLACGERQ